MPRKPSEATQLRNLKMRCRELENALQAQRELTKSRSDNETRRRLELHHLKQVGYGLVNAALALAALDAANLTQRSEAAENVRLWVNSWDSQVLT